MELPKVLRRRWLFLLAAELLLSFISGYWSLLPHCF